MNHSMYNLENHIQNTIDRIAEERLSVEPVTPGESNFFVGARQRVGTILIQIGERVGGPEVRTVRPVTPRPGESLMLGF